MKESVKKIIGIVITVVLTWAMVQGMGWLLDPEYSGVGYDVIRAFHSLERDSLDVIVYGSSHTWRGIDTRVMREKYDLAAHNYGCNWQAMNVVELFLEDSLRTQSPKVVCIDTYTVNKILIDKDMDGQIYYTRAMDNFEGKRKFLKQCFGDDIERYASYYFPLIMFHDNWNKITKESFTWPDYKEYVESTGFRASDTVYSCQLPDYRNFKQLELEEESIRTLDEIVSACNEKNVRIIFVTIPWEGEYDYSDAMKDYSEKNNCEYIDLFEHLDEMGLDGKTDLRDADHLNSSGAAKVADYLGKYIRENYDI